MRPLLGKYAKLDGVVLCGDIHPSTVIHLDMAHIGANENQDQAPIIIIGHARDCSCCTFMAKLGGMVLFVDPHPSTSILSVNCTCEN